MNYLGNIPIAPMWGVLAWGKLPFCEFDEADMHLLLQWACTEVAAQHPPMLVALVGAMA